MKKPIVAIIGRPNVGKSTLFNKLAGKRISIVEDTPGVTRDRIYADIEWLNYKFTIIDTGGLEPLSQNLILKQIYEQTEIAINAADIIIFLLDAKSGILDIDIQVANILRKSKKNILVVVNKIDNMVKSINTIYEFYSLGLGDPIGISAGQGLGLGDMLDSLVKYFPKINISEKDEDIIKIAIVGKPNVGKSSLINKILKENRVIVSNIPGTTRDAIDTFYEKDNKKYLFIDTAGIRKKSKIKENIEHYSIVRAVSAIERCDICILLISAEDNITEQDTKIAGIAHERGKATIVAINKWDLIEKDNNTVKNFTKDIEQKLSYMKYSLKIFISALTGQRINKLFEHINSAYESATLRITTGFLNDVLLEATATTQPPSEKGKQLKIYYITQVSIKPPTFILFVNNTKLLHFSYKRYIENQIRQYFNFKGTPIHFIIKNKSERS